MLLIASHLQHLGSFSVSLKNMVYYKPIANSLHLQHSILKFKIGNILFKTILEVYKWDFHRLTRILAWDKEV